MKKPFLSSLVFALVLAVLSSGCATIAGAIIGGIAAPSYDDATYAVTYEELQKLNQRTEIVIYTKEEITFTGNYLKATPPEPEHPLSGVTIRAKGNEIVIPWGNIEKVEAKERNITKGVFLGLAAGAAIDVATIVLMVSTWEFNFDPDWDGI
ncbi:hypothetical protein [Phaeodactylibacter xiamenensis]|uniref:hypothetical protein n=1 Tax=Phaeodactylibacter xiamenensis TaxID=1524460 RepID=UPI003BA8D2CC